ncbi:HisA/HisF-related TIM barrel protein [Ornithinimicrobium sp. W1679]|uniref:HisA/HisF-related TIM barrel protein n=1 Tax=unclassified Ornithinimicrobium TaxID=2615080 RepID=UPI003CEF3606
MSSFELLPAVDVAGRRAVQVVGPGPADPLEVARHWIEEGAERIHLVDLDRAFGRSPDPAFLAGLVQALPVPVQLSGGLDDGAAVSQALATGAWRVNLATTALQDPVAVGRLLAAEGPRIAVGVDVLGDRVVARGSGVDLGPLVGVLDLLVELLTPTTAGAVVLADAGRDGRRSGADVGLLARVVARLGTRVPVVSSGGIAELDDLRALRAAGASGAVLGAALYHGAFTLSQAKEAVA